MAKAGFPWYQVDTDRYQDIKIKRLKKDFGPAGVAVYDYILSEIYRVKGCFLVWDDSTAFDVADYWGLKESLVREIVSYCGVVGLFDNALLTCGNIISSLSIQARYREMCKRAKRSGIEIPEECRIIPEKTKKIPEEHVKIPEETSHSIGEYSREEESIEYKIESCLTIAMLDTRWVKASKATHEELLKFNSFLETQAVYQKNPADYKRHFTNWKKKGGLQNPVLTEPDQTGGSPKLSARELRDKQLLDSLR